MTLQDLFLAIFYGWAAIGALVLLFCICAFVFGFLGMAIEFIDKLIRRLLN